MHRPDPISRRLVFHADSTNARYLRAQARLLGDARVEFAPALDTILHFHPDRATLPPPDPVRRFKHLVRSAEGILLASPEYAHGIPGVLKNALDWIVATGELSRKPILLASVSSTGGPRVLGALHRVLTVMEGDVQVPPLSSRPAHVRAFLDREGVITDETHEDAGRLREAVRAFSVHLASSSA